jgi:dihydrofolate reductase
MLNIIAAVADNGVIGRNQGIPWWLSDDMRWFKDRTGIQPVAMGRKTFNSIPPRFRPLPGRENIILTRDKWNGISESDNVTIEHDFEPVIQHAKFEDIWIIGGSEIYALALPHADELYLTRVHAQVEGDTFFPKWDECEWKLVWAQDNLADEKNEFNFSWEVYRRNHPHRRTDHPYIEMENCRTDHQKRIMQEILEAGHCPFCPENFTRWHKPRILREGEHWIVSYNQWPYTNASVHLLLVLKTHATDMASVPTGAGEEYFEHLKWAEKEFGITGGAQWNRFGDPMVTGATVRHLHGQLVEPSPLAREPVLIYVG